MFKKPFPITSDRLVKSALYTIDQNGWTKGTWGWQDPAGPHCVEGAVDQALNVALGTNEYWRSDFIHSRLPRKLRPALEVRKSALEAIELIIEAEDLVRYSFSPKLGVIPGWNDHPHTTIDGVRYVMEKAESNLLVPV